MVGAVAASATAARVGPTAECDPITVEHTFIILFAISTIVAVAVASTRVPYAVALVVVGLVAGSFHVLDPPHLTKDLLFSLFLPGLIFEAAYNLHPLELRRSWRTVTALAGPGIIVCIVVTGLATAWALRVTGLAPAFSWKDGLVFAALVSATDPIAVVSLFRKLGVEPRLTTLVEAESLFNDGTSIVALSLILGFVDGAPSSIAALAAQFVLVVCGGGAIGAVIGYGIQRLTRHINEPMVEITLTTIAAYGSFVVAEDLRVSGVIATVVAGLMLGPPTRQTSFSATDTRRGGRVLAVCRVRAQLDRLSAHRVRGPCGRSSRIGRPDRRRIHVCRAGASLRCVRRDGTASSND